MKKTTRHALVAFAVALLLSPLAALGAADKERDLAQGFANPLASARPGVWWIWIGGNVTKEGITRDLEEMTRQGVGSVVIYDCGDWRDFRVVTGPVAFLGPQWHALFKHALAEAARLGVEVSMPDCSGWNCGGPWIKAEHACQKVIWSEKRVEGPAKFAGVLPMPAPVVDKHYREIAVVAFRTSAPADGIASQGAGQATATQSSTAYRLDAARAIDGNTSGAWGHGSMTYTGGGDPRPWWQVDLGQDAAIDEIEIWRRTDAGQRNDQLNNADVLVLDARKKVLWKTNLGVVANPSVRLKVGTPATTQAGAKEVPAARARYVRIERRGVLSIAEVLVFSGGKNIALKEPAGRKRIQDWEAKAVRVTMGPPVEFRPGPGPEAAGVPDVQSGSLVDLSAKMGAEGRLEWDVPRGSWLMLRFGHTAQGAKTHASTPAGAGYEVDPLSAEAVDLHFAALARKMIEAAGPQAGKVLRSFFIDSYEAGAVNWTSRFRDEFQQRRRYDLLPYLPVLSGRIVQSGDVSERFLWDYRRTIADLYADNLFGRTAELLRAQGVGFEAEAYGGYFDMLQAFGRTAIPWGEFWSSPTGLPDALPLCQTPMDASTKASASAGHIYGKPVIRSESFTCYDKWQTYPFLLKAYGDRAFCAGINQTFSVACAHQPKFDDKPGVCPYWGPILDRNTTWWAQSHAWHDYLARCAFLLQQGLYVADVCCFRGEGVPYSLCLEPALIPAGYGDDQCNAEVLLTRMSVKDGRLILPDGMSYRLLVLPEDRSMTPRVLRKIAELVEAGATVVGPKPSQSPSLMDYPACDEQVRALAEKVWGPCDGKTVKEHAFGKGKVVWNMSLQETLRSAGVPPDFEFVSGQKEPVVRCIHRRDQGAEIYFVANQRNRYEELQCLFRVNGKAPELWMPDTGRICRPAVYDEVDGRTRMPLRLDPLGSVFVVFRRPTEAERIVSFAKDGQAIFPGSPTVVKGTPVIELQRGEDATAELKVWEPGKYELKTAAGKIIQLEQAAIPPSLEIAGPWELRFPPGLGARRPQYSNG